MVVHLHVCASHRTLQIVATKQQENVKRERDILAACVAAPKPCPFIVRLFGTFQNSEHVGLVLEFVQVRPLLFSSPQPRTPHPRCGPLLGCRCMPQGGELFKLLGSRGRLSIPHARFYGACIQRGLAALHGQLGVVYRDMKPEVRPWPALYPPPLPPPARLSHNTTGGLTHSRT